MIISTSELVKEQHMERRDPLCGFFTKLLRNDTLQDFFVVVRWFTADSSLLQPTGRVNSTPHTSHFSQCCTTDDTHTRGSSRKFGVRTSHSMCHLLALMLCVWFSSTSPLSSLCCLSSPLSSCLSSWPSTASSTMWWTNSLCTSANEDLGTLAEYNPLTSYEPNDYHISEATEPYIQESSGENGSLNDLEYDDVTIGKALSSPLFTQEREDDASRRRAYHSQDEGLSSSQSSSSQS